MKADEVTRRGALRICGQGLGKSCTGARQPPSYYKWYKYLFLQRRVTRQRFAKKMLLKRDLNVPPLVHTLADVTPLKREMASPRKKQLKQDV